MPVDAPILYNNFWVYLRDSMGPAYGTPNTQQVHNAEIIYSMLRVFGYTANAACGILGNMQTESGLSPGALQGATAAQLLPDGGEHLASLPNNVMLNYYQAGGGCGTGLIQWDGSTNTPPAGNQIASFATRYQQMWFNGELQIFRLEAEYILDPTGGGGINGTTQSFWSANRVSPAVNWSAFRSSTASPEDCADIFRECRERSSGDPSGNQHRRDNARQWYTRFSGLPVDHQISGLHNAMMAYLFRDSGYTYSQYDCIHFVNLVRSKAGIPTVVNGTNSLWRSPTDLIWKGTMQDCMDYFGSIPIGAYLFKCYPEGTPGYETIPDQYRGDGIGNFDHIGIYTLMGKGVMQSGGYDEARTGVADTAFHPTQTDPPLAYDWWTHVAVGVNIIIQTHSGTPGVLFFLINMANKKRRKYKSEKRQYG